MAPAPELVAQRALRRFKVVWTLSWAIKFAVFFAFLLLVVELTGGH